MNHVYVNGKHYELPNGNIKIINHEVYVNDKLVGDEYLAKGKKPSLLSKFWHGAVDTLEDFFDNIIDWLDDLFD